jgi:hypothetical protein
VVCDQAPTSGSTPFTAEFALLGRDGVRADRRLAGTGRGVPQRDVVNEDFAQVVATAFGAGGVRRPQQRSRVGQRLLGEPPPPMPRARRSPGPGSGTGDHSLESGGSHTDYSS